MFKRSSSFIIISILFVLMILSVLFFYWSYRTKKNEIIQYNIDNLQNKIMITESIYYHMAHLVFETQFNYTDLEELMHEAVHAKSDQEKRAIRYKLYERSIVLYSILLKYNFRQFHYHLPSTESFLRMHKPNRYGDLLADTRKTVLEANRQLKEQIGFEEGKVYNGYRFVFPLFYNREHVGSVEFSTSASMIIKNLKELYGYDYHFLISKEVVDKHVFEESRLENYIPSTINPNFYVDLQAVDKDLLEKFSNLTGKENPFSNCCQDIQDFKPFCNCISTENGKYLVTGVPIENYSGEKVGYFLQFSQEFEPFNLIWRHFLTRSAAIVCVFTLMIFLTIFYLKYMTNKEALGKLETVSAMSVTASHEMNQPLQIMLMHVEMLETSSECGEECFRRIQKIHECIKRIQEILHKMNNLKSISLNQYTENEMMVDLDKSFDEKENKKLIVIRSAWTKFIADNIARMNSSQTPD